MDDWVQGSAHSDDTATTNQDQTSRVGLEALVARPIPVDTPRTGTSEPPTDDAARSASFAGAWELTRALSPRHLVRTGEYDSRGRYIYPTTHRLPEPAPTVPWAIYLTDTHEQFRLLAFDFDAKPKTPDDADRARAAADRDALDMAALLIMCGIEHVVCESGPGGGRHVWLALADPLPVQVTSRLAKMVRDDLGLASLDIAPLCNARYGVVRPPGAPHRHGGLSRVMAGDLAVLATPSTTRAQIDQLLAIAATTADTAEPAATMDRSTTAAASRPGGPLLLATDPEGAPHLAGARRALSARARNLAHSPLDPGEDASRRMVTVLCAAAAARWHREDVAADLARLPGLEHLRTIRGADGNREPRPDRGAHSPTAILARFWSRAVAHVATTAADGHDDADPDPEFAARLGDVDAAIDHLQTRADVSVGRWDRKGGPSDRLVLDELCTIAGAAVRLVVAADIRTLGDECGISRESARRALHRLAADGWIRLHEYADGPHAAVWALQPYGDSAVRQPPTALAANTGKNAAGESVHREPDLPVSLVDTRPAAPRPHTRLQARLGLARHDCFDEVHPEGLGTAAALIYARLPASRTSRTKLRFSWADPAMVDAMVETLHAAGLITVTAAGIERTDPAARDAYAQVTGTAGILDFRAEQYRLEREVWKWWLDELTHMSTPGPRDRKDRRRQPGQLAIEDIAVPSWIDRPPYPRGTSGRADHRAARRTVEIDSALMTAA